LNALSPEPRNRNTIRTVMAADAIDAAPDFAAS